MNWIKQAWRNMLARHYAISMIYAVQQDNDKAASIELSKYIKLKLKEIVNERTQN
jgi:hypothetical protein